MDARTHGAGRTRNAPTHRILLKHHHTPASRTHATIHQTWSHGPLRPYHTFTCHGGPLGPGAVRGGRAVPGALAYSIAEGLLVQSTMQHTGLAFLHMEMDVKGPTFVGDTLHVEVEVLEVRQTSKGNRGLVRTRNEVKNQNGETVIVYTPLRMVAGREE